MSDDVKLVGLDFGTTTSSAVVATATLTRSAVTGRMELSQVCERYRSEMVFTPLDEEDRLDEARLEAYLDTWLAAGEVGGADLFGGGALLTGLTAQKQNAAALVKLVRRRLGDALIATADDPRLESWLAFMGSCAGLSRSRPRQPIINLDVGGGTTNLAFGLNGEVLRTGCYFVGARHVQVVPGTYCIVKLSRYARSFFHRLDIHKGAGDELTNPELQAILDFYVALLERSVSGAADVIQEPIAQLHVQVPLRRPPVDEKVAITFSGGVGELIYRHLQRNPWPPQTHFGDLGIDLAKKIVSSPVWAEDLEAYRPATAGRATVYGLLRHSTEVSGSTLFLPRPEMLPLTDIPIFGSLTASSADGQISDVIELVKHSTSGGGVWVALGTYEAAAVRTFGERMARELRMAEFFPDRPLVLLVHENLGKVLGQYVTQWGALRLSLVVIDEVTVREAQYVQIGRPRGQVVSVSFYGLNEQGDSQ